MHINIQGLRNKIDALELIAHSNQVDVLCIAEHWLNTHNQNAFSLETYDQASCFVRSTHQHGGVCIYVREDHEHVEVENIISRSIEKECELSGTYLTKLNIIVIAIYRSPSANVGVFFETLEEIMTNVIQQHDPETKIYLAGDFNIDMSRETSTSRELLNIMNSFGLKPSVSNYTREATNSRGTVQTIIDNIYTNDTDHSARILKCGISDHHAIVVGCPLVIIPSTTCQLKTRRTSPEGLAYFSSLVSQETF